MFNASTLATKYVFIAGAAAILSACSTTPSSNNALDVDSDEYRQAIGVYSDPTGDENMDPIAAAAFWGTRYNTNQADPMIAVRFSRALRKIGSNDEAVGVMEKTAALHASNVDVSMEYGKVLVENGRAFEAVRYLETAAMKSPNDWRAMSAYGVALDQIGEHQTARTKYDRALAVSPNEVTVLNNKGLSFALEGDLSSATALLRTAAGNAGANSRVRQNLALVLALSGDMREAERLARSDLPPLVADNNIDVYRQLTAQPAYWDQYASGDVETPKFDDVPAAPLAPSPKPQLREQPKPKEESSDGAPIALIEAAPITNASAVQPAPEVEAEFNDEPAVFVAPAPQVDAGIELKPDN